MNVLRNKQDISTKRYPHFDILRILAVYLVIFNHTGERGFMLFFDKMDSPVSALYMILSVFCKIAVPLFFMISGALLLKKDESLKQLFFKRILRIASVLILISVPYYYWVQRENGLGITDFLRWIYSDSAATFLWYLYSYIALLLMLPFLRSMVKGMQNKDFVYLIIGYIVFVGILPRAEYLLWNGETTIHKSLSPVLFLTENVFFAVAGYYFECVFDSSRCNRKYMCCCGLLSIVAILITCFMTYRQAHVEDVSTTQQMERFFNCFICIPTISVYCFVKHIGNKIKSARVCKAISILGSAVFGVYLIEKLLRAITGSVFNLLSPYVGSFAGSLIWSFVILTLGLIIVVGLKNIPVVKRVVNIFI